MAYGLERKITIDLPPGFTIRTDYTIGANYIDDSGRIIVQHPWDCDEARKLVWKVYQENPRCQDGEKPEND